MTDRQHLVDATALIDELAHADPPTVLDVRWSLTGGGRSGYEAGHLPGAVFVDLDADLAGPPGAGGRHPLPDPAALEAALRRAGVRTGHPVVAYDAGGSAPTGAAARAWWILRWAGISGVRALDGGFAAWVAAGGPVSTEVPRVEQGDVTVRVGALPVLAADAAGRTAAAGVLIDGRVAPRYRGEVEPVDRVAGHIPGAVNQPVAQTVDATGRLRSPAELRAAFADLGVRAGVPVGAYCGSGVTAAHTLLALTVAGVDAGLYVGSWSQWITDRSRPVAVGEEPNG
jgi:thiosulfate/3-mercaptopyruvate sulfurtransferase